MPRESIHLPPDLFANLTRAEVQQAAMILNRSDGVPGVALMLVKLACYLPAPAATTAGEGR